jgi:alpha(1,3/1,4) fucosyltransferase
MKISIIPFRNFKLENQLFKGSEGSIQNKLEPYFYLKEYLKSHNIHINTYDITSIKDAELVIFFDLKISALIKSFIYRKLRKSIYIQYEPPVVEPLNKPSNLKWISKIFNQVLTWQDDLIDDNFFSKFYYPIPSKNKENSIINFNDKKYITTIIGYKSSNQINELYSERIKAINFFQKKYSDFVFFGRGWDKSLFKSFNGEINSKIEVLKNFKFVICYENESKINGLISEKIFDCFYANSLPVFLGAQNISAYFPSEIYIDKRDFSTYDELDNYLLSINEKEYNHRISSIQKYLKSDSFRLFLKENFAKSIHKSILLESKKPGISMLKQAFYLLKILFSRITNRFLNFIYAK